MEELQTEAERPKLLIIDDDELVARALRRSLRADFEIRLCSSAQEALGELSETAFGCVLCDVNMPQMNGRTFLEALRARDQRLAARVIFMSGGVDADDQEFMASAGRPVVTKPFDLDDLRDRLLEICSAPEA